MLLSNVSHKMAGVAIRGTFSFKKISAIRANVSFP
jgi:hypothetical protein